MKAKEMFETLGYDQEITNGIIWYTCNKNDNLVIAFDINEKLYWACDLYDPLRINFEIHKAITQQMKELGWIE